VVKPAKTAKKADNTLLTYFQQHDRINSAKAGMKLEELKLNSEAYYLLLQELLSLKLKLKALIL